jgi:hypothetical protein
LRGRFAFAAKRRDRAPEYRFVPGKIGWRFKPYIPHRAINPKVTG